jgi:hypothetical protein
LPPDRKSLHAHILEHRQDVGNRPIWGAVEGIRLLLAETKSRGLLGKEVENDRCYWGETAGALAYGWPGGTITVSVSVTTTVSVKTTVSG